VLASNAVTVTVYPVVGGTVTAFGTVAGLRVKVVCPFLVASAWEVAVTVMLVGSPGAIVGAVYVVGLAVVELSEPQGFDAAVHDTPAAEVLKSQVTF